MSIFGTIAKDVAQVIPGVNTIVDGASALANSTPKAGGGGKTYAGTAPITSLGNGQDLLKSYNGAPNVIQSNQNSIDQSQAQAFQLSQQTSALLKQIAAEEAANAPGNPISIDTNAIQSQAKVNAANTVNPLYTQYMNNYLQEMAANQAQAKAQNDLNINTERSAEGNTLAQNQLAVNAAAATNAGTQGNINVQQQNYELQSGNAQNAKMAAIESSIGSGNLGASGLGGQQLYQAENARNVADAAQRGQFQYQRDSSNLSTQDTFAQLAQSSQYAQTQEGQQEAQTNFNLNDYLRQAAYNDNQYQQALEASRQQALTATTAQETAMGTQNAINASGVGGKNLVATNQAYSSLLSGASSSLPTAPNPQDYFTKYDTSV